MTIRWPSSHVRYQRASVRRRSREVGGGIIAEKGETEGGCAVGEPQSSLRAGLVLREARKCPGAGNLDRVVRSDRVEAADLAGEPLRGGEIQRAAAASERNRLAH